MGSDPEKARQVIVKPEPGMSDAEIDAMARQMYRALTADRGQRQQPHTERPA